MENLDFSLDIVSNMDPGKVSEQDSDITEPREVVQTCGYPWRDRQSQPPLAPVSLPLLPTPWVSRKNQTPNLGFSRSAPCTLP